MTRFLVARIFLAVCLGAPGLTAAQTVAPGHTIRSRAIITPADLVVLDAVVPGTFKQPGSVIGQEARVILYPGRPIRITDVGPPTVVERNQIVALIYSSGTLSISTDGRALARGGIGDRIRVMNLASKSTISGVIESPQTIRVSQ